MTITNAVDSFDAVMADVRKFGGEQGAGDNARANVFIRLVRGAANGVIDTIKRDKDGNEVNKGGRDHAEMAYEAYINSYGRKNAHSADTKTAKTATLRAGIKLGQMHGDNAIALMNKAHVTYKDLKAADEKVWQPLDAYYRVALAQMKVDHRLTDDEVRACMVREEKERDASAFLRTAVKALEKACALDDSDDARNALEAAQHALAAFMSQEQKAADLAALAILQQRLGMAA